MKLKNVSDNSMSDLLGLMNEIEDNINNRYLHVSDHLPESFVKSVQSLKKEILKEFERREEFQEDGW